MIEESQTYQRIEDYLADRLNTAEKIQFENDLSTNADLQKLFDKHQAAASYLEAQALSDFKVKLNKGMPGKSRGISSKLVFATLGIFLALGTGFWLYNSYWKETGSKKDASSLVTRQGSADDKEEVITDRVENNGMVAKDRPNTSKEGEKVVANNPGEIRESNSDRVEEVDVRDVIDKRTGGGTNKGIGTGNDVENSSNNPALEEETEALAQKEMVTEVEEIDCSKFDPRADLKERASFNSLGEGKIEITNKNKSTSYFIYIDENTRQRDVAVFEHLDQGAYQVKIENDQGCIYTKKYTLRAQKVD